MKPIQGKELEEYRYLFPVTKKFIYLNHAGVAPISLRVADAVSFFNQDALHHGYTAAAAWEKKIAKIRGQCAELIHAGPDEIAFVKNTSHGISLIARGLQLQAGDEVIISESEFPSNVYPWMALEKDGVVIKKIPEQNGELLLEKLPELISPKTKVLALSWIQYGSGFRLPLEKIGLMCRAHGIYFFVDAIQGLGAFPIDVEKANIDFLAADAHKWLLGHEGIGFLYVRQELIEKIEPMLLGWNSVVHPWNFDEIHFALPSNARRFEEGSANGLSIYGLGGAVELILEVGIPRIAERILKLTQQLMDGITALDLRLYNSQNPDHRSGIVSFHIPGDETGERLIQLQKHLFAEKIYSCIRRKNLRFSPHFYNSEEEIQITLACLQKFLDND